MNPKNYCGSQCVNDLYIHTKILDITVPMTLSGFQGESTT